MTLKELAQIIESAAKISGINPDAIESASPAQIDKFTYYISAFIKARKK